MKTPEEIKALTENELSHELTETRITLESIYPLKYRDISKYRSLLLAEVESRKTLNKKSQ